MKSMILLVLLIAFGGKAIAEDFSLNAIRDRAKYYDQRRQVYQKQYEDSGSTDQAAKQAMDDAQQRADLNWQLLTDTNDKNAAQSANAGNN